MCNKFSGTARPGKATSGNIGFIQININWGNSSPPACPLQSVLSMCFGQKRIWHLVRVGALKSPLSSSLVSLTFPSPAHNVSHNTPSALLPNGFPLMKKMYYMSIQTCKQLLHGNILSGAEAAKSEAPPSMNTRPVHKNLFLEFPKYPGRFMLHFDI